MSAGGAAASPVSVATRSRVRVAKRAARLVVQAYARPTAGLRVLPGYLIIGAQRAGTTSLHRYLAQHPAVGTMLRTKGVHFFDSPAYVKGMAWYAAHFPSRAYGWWVRSRTGATLLTGEASPYYLFHPSVPARVATHLPGVKLIVLLRDPVQRAYSHHQHEVARGFETLGFEEAIEREPERLTGETERLLADPLATSFSHQHHSYLARGLYAEQLAAWWAHVPAEQMLVLSSERFFADPAAAFRRVLDFLGLPPFTPSAYGRHNAHTYGRIGGGVRQRLAAYFREPNRRLYAALGSDLDWDP